MAAVADELVSRMRAAGVRAIFGLPGGGGNLDIIEAAGAAGLPFVLTATETGSAIAAIAQAEVTHAPGACITTLGPGAASVVNGVACAYLDRAPIVVVTDAPASGAFEHQRLDQSALLRPVTKWSAPLTCGRAEAVIDEGFAQLAALPPGPVHFDWMGGKPVAGNGGPGVISGGVISGGQFREMTPATIFATGTCSMPQLGEPLFKT